MQRRFAHATEQLVGPRQTELRTRIERIKLNCALCYLQRLQMLGGIPKLAGKRDVRDVALLNQPAQCGREIRRIGKQALDQLGGRRPIL